MKPVRPTLAWLFGLLALGSVVVAGAAWHLTPFCIFLDPGEDDPACADWEPWNTLFLTFLPLSWMFLTLTVMALNPGSRLVRYVRRALLAALGVVNLRGGVTGAVLLASTPGDPGSLPLALFLPAGVGALFFLGRDFRQAPIEVSR